MKKIVLYFYIALAAATLFACINNSGDIIKKQGPYIGSKLPGTEPELFAPGIVANGYRTRDVAITPDGKELYFGIFSAGHYSILVTREVSGGWSKPEVLEHMENPRYMNIEPALNYDGSKLFFLSNRPDSAMGVKEGEQDIWVMDRQGDHWSKPYNLGPPVNTNLPEFYPSLTKDGTLYFTRNDLNSATAYIYRSKFVNGTFQEPEKLPEQVNSGKNHYNAFVAQDESYIIVPTVGREDSFGGTDYYIVFRTEDDKWSNPINMGDRVNTPNTFEYSAYVTSDGKILFFMSLRMAEDPEKLSYDFLHNSYSKAESGNPSIYWMDAGFIDTLRVNAVFE